MARTKSNSESRWCRVINSRSAKLEKVRGNKLATASVECSVNGKPVSSANLMFAIADAGRIPDMGARIHPQAIVDPDAELGGRCDRSLLHDRAQGQDRR